MHFQLITPEAIFFEGDATLVTIPGSQGQFGVMDNHAPFVSTLRAGVVTIEQTDGTTKQVVVFSGIAEVTGEQCRLLAETAEDCSGISASDAKDRLAKAQALAEEAVTDEEKQSVARDIAIAEALIADLA